MCDELISYLSFIKGFTTYFVFVSRDRKEIYGCQGKAHEAAGSIRRVKCGTMSDQNTLVESCPFSQVV